MKQVRKSDTEKIMLMLAKLQSDVNYLKKHVKDEDIFLTKEEEKLLKDSYMHEKEEGKLVSHEDLKKELGI